MLDALLYPADFELAQRCLEGDAQAIEQLQRVFGPVIAAYLVHRGASSSQAHELTDGLWADCLSERAETRPRLASYCGQAPLQAWLKTVALNRLIRLHAEERRRVEVHLADDLAKLVPSSEAAGNAELASEAPLLVLMRAALEAAFQKCPAEDFVLLQLAHANQLYGDELARMFNCSAATISRRLDVAQKMIAEETIRHIRLIDPLIDLKWEDFVELCRVASPACFGVD